MKPVLPLRQNEKVTQQPVEPAKTAELTLLSPIPDADGRFAAADLAQTLRVKVREMPVPPESLWSISTTCPVDRSR